MSFWQENKIPLAIVFSGILIALSIYFALKQPSFNISKIGNEKTETKEKEENKESLVNLTPTKTSLSEEKPSPTIGVPQLNEDQIKQRLVSKTTIPLEKLDYEIGERLDRENKILLRGVVKNRDEVSGAGFFGYCDLEKCEITFVGQGVPKCSEVNPYNYPLNWADYCLNESDNLIKR